jgi:hypothetical protein
VATLQEKYLQKTFKIKNKLMLVRFKQARQNNESAIISLEDAKAVLSNYLSEDELKKCARLKKLKSK